MRVVVCWGGYTSPASIGKSRCLRSKLRCRILLTADRILLCASKYMCVARVIGSRQLTDYIFEHGEKKPEHNK